MITRETVQGQECVHAVLDDLLEAPRVVRASHGRDLDGDIVDVLASHEARHLCQAVCRLFLAENRLAEEVHVQAVPALTQARERGAEALVSRIDDEITDDLAEHASRNRRHSAGREARGGRSEPHRRGQGRGQEVFTASRQALQRLTGHI